MTKDEALKLCDYLEGNDASMEAQCKAAAFIREVLAQPDYRAVKTYHEGKPVYVSQTEFPPECKTEAEQTAYALAQPDHIVDANKMAQPAQEPDELTIAYMSGLYDGKKKRPWIGLTEEERQECVNTPFVAEQWANIEAKLKEKNT